MKVFESIYDLDLPYTTLITNSEVYKFQFIETIIENGVIVKSIYSDWFELTRVSLLENSGQGWIQLTTQNVTITLVGLVQ